MPLPAKRSYDTHHYYVVEVHARAGQEVDPRDIAASLVLSFVERAGELKNHWLVRSEKPMPTLAQTFEKRDGESSSSSSSIARPDSRNTKIECCNDGLRSAGQLLNPASLHNTVSPNVKHTAALSIKAVERQEVRRRHKRDIIYDPAEMPHLYPELRNPVASPMSGPFT